ncbi:MAG: hypothetical protein ACREM3_02240 [Candidatus Rokuibacteriota bacterium]
MLVASSVLFLALLLYVLFVSYLPAKQRVGRLETELKEVQARQARSAQQVDALRAERETLSRRVEELEKQLAEAEPASRRR